MPSDESLVVGGVLAIALLLYLSRRAESRKTAAAMTTSVAATPEAASEILVRSIIPLSAGVMNEVEKALLLIHPAHPVNREHLRLHIIAASTAIGLQLLGEAYAPASSSRLIVGARDALGSADARMPRIFRDYVGLVPVGEGSDSTPYLVAEMFARNMLVRITADAEHVRRVTVILFGFMQSIAIQGVDRSFTAIRASIRR